MKKIMSIILALPISLVTLSFSGASSGVEQAQTSSFHNVSLYPSNKNLYSAELFGKFAESLPTENVDGVNKTVYPENYAGAYIDDNDVLHIKVVDDETVMGNSFDDDSKKYISVFEEKTGVDNLEEDVLFERADVSLKKLLEIQKILEPVMVKYHISATATDEEKNILRITVTDDYQKSDIIAFLKENINDFNEKSVEIVSGGGIFFTAENTSNNALAGSFCYSDNSSATLGFNAYQESTNSYGVVTAGHFVGIGDTVFNAKSYSIGTVSASKVSGSIDAAFIPFNSRIIVSDKLNKLSSPNDTLTGFYPSSSIIQGMATTKIGNASNVNTGVVRSANASAAYMSDIFNDLVYISNTQLTGDSGGPVFTAFTGPISAGSIRPNTLIGIVTFADYLNYGYASKAANIMNEYGLDLY